MKYKYFFLLLSLSILSSCSSKFEYSEICNCYSKSKGENLDTKLNACLKTDAKNKITSTDELKKIAKSLIVNCSEYQTDFNRILFLKFESPRPNFVAKKDSLLNCVDRNINIAENLCKLAEISILENDLENAMKFINESLGYQNDVEYCYWIKSFIFQKKKDFPNAIKELEIGNNYAKNDDSKFFNELIILSLKQEAKK